MKLPAILPALVLFASPMLHADGRGLRDTSGTAETVFIASEFSVEIEYPNFVISVLAHLTGAHFERLLLEEWDFKTPAAGPFLFHLSEGEDRWLEIASDPTFPSYVTLPREDRTEIRPGALNFVKSLVAFFQSPRADTLHAVFEYAGDTLCARAFQRACSTDPGSGVTTLSRVETWNRSTGEAYINGDVQAVTAEGYTTYKDIRIALMNKDVRMHFTPQHIGIARNGQGKFHAGESAQNTLLRPD